jgi:hypothetical protein
VRNSLLFFIKDSDDPIKVTSLPSMRRSATFQFPHIGSFLIQAGDCNLNDLSTAAVDDTREKMRRATLHFSLHQFKTVVLFLLNTRSRALVIDGMPIRRDFKTNLSMLVP